MKSFKTSSLLVSVILIALSPPGSDIHVAAYQVKLTLSTMFKCGGDAVCILDPPDEVLDKPSQVECVLECNRRQTCVGVNYRQQYKKQCEFYHYKITDYSDSSKNVPGCQYIQKGNVDNLQCAYINGCAQWTNGGICTFGAISYGFQTYVVCLKLCYFMPTCTSVDYNSDTTCWIHFSFGNWVPNIFNSCTKFWINRSC